MLVARGSCGSFDLALQPIANRFLVATQNVALASQDWAFSSALIVSQLAQRWTATMKLHRTQPTIPSTLPVPFTLTGRPYNQRCLRASEQPG